MSIAALMLLAACGGGGGLVDEVASRDDVIAAFQRAEGADSRLSDLPGTRFDAMPTSGTASFEGQGGFLIDPAPRRAADDISIFGDAALTADFRRGTLTGTVANLTGVQGANPATGQIFDVDGEVTLGARGSAIGEGARRDGSGVPNDVSSRFSGQLRTEDRGTFDVSGVALGKFLGTRADQSGTSRAPRAIVLDADSPSIVRDGRRIQGNFSVYGEN